MECNGSGISQAYYVWSQVRGELSCMSGPGAGKRQGVIRSESHLHITSLSLSRSQIGSQGQLREQREINCSGDLCQNVHFPLTLTSYKIV